MAHAVLVVVAPSGAALHAIEALFIDVLGHHYAAEAVDRLRSSGATGHPTFHPGRAITRDQTASLPARIRRAAVRLRAIAEARPSPTSRREPDRRRHRLTICAVVEPRRR